MTSHITRSSFTSLHAITIDEMPAGVQEALEASHIDRATLEEIAGSDRVIRGDELGRLYDTIRERNRDARGGSIDAVARVYEALRGPAVDAISGATPRFGAGIRGEMRSARRPELDDGPAEEPVREEPTSGSPAQPDLPQLPEGYEHRLRKVNRREVLTHTVIAPADLLRARQIAALPPATQGNLQPVRSYIDAIAARDQRAAMEASGQREAARRIGRPEGVSEDQWALTRALQIEGISTQDVENYLATGQLPDLLDERGEVVMTGAERMDRLERAATRGGSWTATNTFTFLISARRSAMAAERQAMTERMNALAPDDPLRAEIESAIAASESLDRDLRRGLQGIYRARTYSAGRNAQAMIDRAAELDEQARQARERGDTAAAERLAAQAQEQRDRGARIGQSEGDYRASMRLNGAGDAYRTAARAQIETGTLRIEDMRRTTGPLPDEVPVELGNDDGSRTSNNVRGAERLLEQAGSADGDNGRNHASLGLETARQSAIAQFHQLHVDRSTYHQRVGENGAPPPPRDAGVERHRQAYLDARAEQSRVIMERIGLYGPIQNLDSADALTVGRLQSENAAIMQEFNAALGTSLATDRQVEAQRTAVGELENAAEQARQGETDALARARDQRSASADQRDAADPWTRVFQTSGQERRDRQAIADANTAERVVDAQAAVATAGRELTEGRLANGRDVLRGLETQQTRDRADADRVRTAMQRNLGAAGRSTNIQNAYDRTRTMGDESARASAAALVRAEEARPANAPRDDRALADIASTRLDLARYWTGTTETHALAMGDAGRTGATERLDTAANLIARADATRAELPAGDLRLSLASGVVRERSALAQANADYRPGVSRDQLRIAEEVANADLAGDEARMGAARAQIGSAAIQSVVRSDARFKAIFESGNHDDTAQDTMYAQAHRMLDRTDLPNSDTVRSSRALLRRFDEGLDQVATMFRRSARQMQNGFDLAAAQTGVMSRAEGQANSVKMSSVITGPVWLFTLGHVDLKDDMQGFAETGAAGMLEVNRRTTETQTRGAEDLARGFESARASGHAMQFLNGYRIVGMNSMGTINVSQQQFERQRDNMKQFLTQSARDSHDWAGFSASALPRPGNGTGVPLAQAMAGSVLGYRDAVEALGDERVAIITGNHEFMLNNARRNLDEATSDMWWYVGANAVGEIGLAIVTLGASAPASVAGVADAANAGRVGLQAANVARTVGTIARITEAIATFRAAHPVISAAGTAVTVGGAMAGANYVARRAFGESGATNFVAVASNFVPIGVGVRAAGLATAGRRAAVLGEEGAAVARNVSWSAVRQALGWEALVAHARFYGPQFAMAGLQVGGSIVVVPSAARALGLERSEFAQAAMNVALGALVTGGFAAGMNRAARRAQSTAVAEQLVEGVVSVGQAEVAQSTRAQMQQAALREIDAFAASTHGRMPTAEEVAGLRTRLVERLGIDPSTEAGRAQAEMIAGVVEGLRVQRAGELGLQQAIRERRTGEGAGTRERLDAMVTQDELSPRIPPTRELVHRAVELAGERLYEARGGEAAGASRVQAYRDAAQQLAGSFHAQARAQVEAHGPSQFAESLVQAESFAGDRATAVEMAARLQTPGPNGQPPLIGSREAARLEPFLATELQSARATLDRTPPNGDMTSHWASVRQRLINEVGLSEPAADATIRTMQGEVYQQSVASRVVGAQIAAGADRPLSNAEIMAVARDTATRMGFSRDAAEVLARDLAQARPRLEEAGMVRPGGETTAEASFRRFREAHPEIADRFLELSPDHFMRAFGEAPNPDRLAVLANDPQFRALAVRDPDASYRVMMRGPEPNLTPPDPHAVQAARLELSTLQPGQRLSDAAAEALLSDTVFAARQALLAERRGMRGHENATPDEAFACGAVAGWCGYGQSLTSTRLAELGLEGARIRPLQAFEVFGPRGGREAYNHAFVVAEMPNGKAYLIDTTFRQFFDGPNGPGGIGRPGHLMRMSERGSRIADQLLERGFVELTPEVAAEYGRALSGVENGRTITVQDYLQARQIPLDHTRTELNHLPPPPPLVAPPGTASAGRPIELSPREIGHVGGGDFRGDRFAGGGHRYNNIAELEARGYRQGPREDVLRYRDDLAAWHQRDAAMRQWRRNRVGDRPPPAGPRPRPEQYGLTSERVYFIERNGNAYVGGIIPNDNRIHRDGHTWFAPEWQDAHVQQAAALLAREGTGVERVDDPTRAKLTAWLRIGQNGRVEMAPPGLADPVSQGYVRVSMIVPTDPNAPRTVFADMRQR